MKDLGLEELQSVDYRYVFGANANFVIKVTNPLMLEE